MQSGLISYLQKDIWKYFTKYEMGWYGPQFEFKFYIVIRLPRKGYQLTISNSWKFILKKTLAPIFVHQIFYAKSWCQQWWNSKPKKLWPIFIYSQSHETWVEQISENVLGTWPKDSSEWPTFYLVLYIVGSLSVPVVVLG